MRFQPGILGNIELDTLSWLMDWYYTKEEKNQLFVVSTIFSRYVVKKTIAHVEQEERQRRDFSFSWSWGIIAIDIVNKSWRKYFNQLAIG